MADARAANFTKWVEEETLAANAAQEGAENSEMKKLTAAVRAQEARVEKVASTLLEVGSSEFLKAKLRQEEDRLRDVRAAVAGAASCQRVNRTPKVTIAEVVAVLKDAERISKKAPRKARDVLAAIIDRVLMVPAPDGYDAEMHLKSRTATLAGGRPLFDAVGCGGRI